jgi:hypothetical protein
MSDQEFDILDELYFVTSFETVRSALNMDEMELKETLQALIGKGWVKCFHPGSMEVVTEALDYDDKFRSYHYLATKEGLLAHNSKQ